MARSSLANSSSKLNLSRRQLSLFRNIIVTGNQMAIALNNFNKQLLLSNTTIKLVSRWEKLMVTFVETPF